MSAIQIVPIPAFTDNYFWLVHNDKYAIIVDPGDAAPVQMYLQRHELTLCAILITHHHADHIGGVSELLVKNLPVYGPLADQENGRIPWITQGCQQDDTLFFPKLNASLDVIEVPGHTRSHIAFYCAELSSLFCGDTLFAGGCGRLFEGTPEQMVSSLHKITALPNATKIYCAHEYTLANLRFALTVEPNNQRLQARFKDACVLREQGLSTVPSQLDLELQTNPFLRGNSGEIIQSLKNHHKLVGSKADEVSVFAALREWKNTF